MKVRTFAVALGMSMMLGTGTAMAWDLHDTLAPGPTPQTADSPPIHEIAPGGSDLRLPLIGGSDGADLRLPDVTIGVPGASFAAVHQSRCTEAIARHGEQSAEAWTQC